MRIHAARIHGRGEVSVDELDLPPIGPEELLLRVVSSSMCMSTYKAVVLGPGHKRVPDDVAEHPTMTGHEFAGVIVEVGAAVADQFQVGEHVAIQPALGLPTGESPGYSYPYYGGDATYTIIPKVAIDHGCVLPYDSNYFANASLAEPMMCLIGAFHANFHTTQYVYRHEMGIRPGGWLALLGAAGPMGLGAIQYALAGPYRPSLVVVADIDQDRLDRTALLLPPESAPNGTRLVYLNTATSDAVADLRGISGGNGFDDVFVFAPVPQLVETADRILATDGCLNFFSGPTDPDFSARLNFYNVHYESTHVVGTSGGATSDMQESLDLSARGAINPSMMVTHIGGLNAVPEAIRGLHDMPGGKRMIYPHIDMPLTAITDFATLGATDQLFADLAMACDAHRGLWNAEAEHILRTALEPTPEDLLESAQEAVR
ncbi:zinc-binding dehydrogenase [Raineyella sp. W15-4]|uniref:zinc-binding dehydrogenase n=1 Tax=Raineyella sp. W15-4 TaxID=3081651 RepID=UPI002954077A|nr:zinc-binding dehydrogenase [Raineyella sp. W15-4]WOQ17361.1 zinc-binding dehydrogenase [Raineyella sp. W15-4]